MDHSSDPGQGIPDPLKLKHFHSLKDLSKSQLTLLAQSQPVHRAVKGQEVLKYGDTLRKSFLLLSGSIVLIARDGLKKIIQAGTESARNPIAQLLPRQYQVIATSTIEYLLLDFELLESLREDSQLRRGGTSSMLVEHTEMDSDSDREFGLPEEDLLVGRLREDLARDKLVLPSLPDTALRIGRAINDESINAARLARIVQNDPAITAKLIRAANSAMYAGLAGVDTCAAAITRLGFNTTHSLVLNFALREVFRARNAVAKRTMLQLWQHSSHVAALAKVLSQVSRQFNPEHAMLAGLLHDIGELAVISYADKALHYQVNAQNLQKASAELRADVGGLILENWDFPNDLVTCAREAEDWHRDPNSQPDYCDLIIVAQLHSYVGSERMRELPSMGELPCFKKLGLEELTPKQSLKILDNAQRQVQETQNMLGG